MLRGKRVPLLERQRRDVEQYSHMNCRIVSGLETRPRSYDGAAAVGVPELHSLEGQVITALNSERICRQH